MSHLMIRGNILSPSCNIMMGGHYVFTKKYTYAKTIFYNNFYETLSMTEIITW